MNREYNEAMDDLRFSPGAKERMAAHLAAAREQARSERPQPDVYAARGGKRRWRFAAAAAVTICARIMNQPANQPTTSPPIRRDHW